MENKGMKRTLIIIVLMLGLALLWYGTYIYCKPIEVEETIPTVEEVEIIDTICKEPIWIPTKEDIAYQDSMYTIILQTQDDVDTIKNSIVYIIEQLEFYDEINGVDVPDTISIRYIEGGPIDQRRNPDTIQ